MDFSVSAVNQILRTYQTQTRISDLNKNNPTRVVQGQVDSVSISKEARELLANPPKPAEDGDASAP